MQQLAEPNHLQPIIEQIWERRHQITPDIVGAEREAIEAVIAELDAGRLRVAEPVRQGVWKVNPWIKQALLLSFRLFDTVEMPQQGSGWFDKVALKFTHWRGEDFRAAGIRTVPGSVVRRSAFIDRNVVLMPSFVNIGAHVGAGTMIDTWATVGSCAQIGRDCHISGGAGIGGVIEPLQADPVIIEDGCFIGARAEVAEGVIVERGAVLAMGVYLGASTRIVDRSSGEVYLGRVPAYSVVVPGSWPGTALPDGSPGPSLYCAVIVKRVDEKTRSRVAINELLRP